MQSLDAVLELVRDARNYIDSGRSPDAAFLLEVIEADLAELACATSGVSVEKRRRPPSYGAQRVHAHAGYSGPFRRRTDSLHGRYGG
jgi:hypothetical protein